MKALSTLKSAIDQSSFGIAALIALVPVILPHYALAAELQTSGQQAQIFEIKVSDPSLLDQTPKSNDNQDSITIDQLADNDPLVIELQAYLEKQDSPLAKEAGKFPQYPQWQRGLAISFVESNFCKKAMNKNCTSIGVAPGNKLWRKYNNYADWMADMSKLMEKPLYKDRLNTFQKMKGVYVQPGSSAWVNGAQKKYDELMDLTQKAENQRQALAENFLSLQTFNQNTN